MNATALLASARYMARDWAKESEFMVDLKSRYGEALAAMERECAKRQDALAGQMAERKKWRGDART